MRRNSHLGSETYVPSRTPKRRSSEHSRIATPIKPPKSMAVESSIVGLPGMKRIDMVAAVQEPKPAPQEEPVKTIAVPAGLTPVPSVKPSEPAFGNRLGRAK